MKKKIVIVGGGESGTGAALLAQKKGYEVFVSDNGRIARKYKEIIIENDIEYEENEHSYNRILEADEVIKSPGIPDTAEVIQKIKENNIPIISEIEFAGRYTNAKMICITGSNGKTTTTLLTYHILKKAGYKVGLAGNVGKSLSYQLLHQKYDIFVLELSSFQLDGITDFRADISILLNITPDHLDRYDYKFEKYIDSKFRITQNQREKDIFIYWKDDPVIINKIKESESEIKAQKIPFGFSEYEKGAYLKRGKLYFRYKSQEYNISTKDISLKGMHNSLNTMAAIIVALSLNVKWDDIKKSVGNFKNIEHRLEYVSTINEIDFINDSKATNISSTWYALSSINQPIIWIVGGVDKGNDYSKLMVLVKMKVKYIICLGKDNSALLKTFNDTKKLYETSSMQEAVTKAYDLSSKGDCILLSPACASFDLFRSYEDRGRKFKKEVERLHTDNKSFL